MRSRRKLRTRIIISFALFGLGLTALFAAATIYMRARLEDQLINNTLVREVKNFADFKRENPQPDARWGISMYDLSIYSARKFAIVPFDWQQYESGVYDIVDRENPTIRQRRIRHGDDQSTLLTKSSLPAQILFRFVSRSLAMPAS
jgi:hypothetical protein